MLLFDIYIKHNANFVLGYSQWLQAYYDKSTDVFNKQKANVGTPKL